MPVIPKSNQILEVEKKAADAHREPGDSAGNRHGGEAALGEGYALLV